MGNLRRLIYEKIPPPTTALFRGDYRVAIGRKNYLFAGSDAGGERAAAIYSLIETAKLNGIDPDAYLRHVIATIADHPVNQIDELLPWNVSTQVLCTKQPD